MNEDGNSTMPQNPVFSSPNNDANSAPTPVQGQPINPSSANGAIVAAAAAMPEEETPAPISSGAIISSQEPSANVTSRQHLFSNRRFKASNSAPQQPAAPVFAGAPDYFNQAAGDIVIANETTQKSSSKKIFIIVAIVVAALFLLLLAVFGMQHSQRLANYSKARKVWNRFGNYAIFGEEKEDDLPEKLTVEQRAVAISEIQNNRYENLLTILKKNKSTVNIDVSKESYSFITKRLKSFKDSSLMDDINSSTVSLDIINSGYEESKNAITEQLTENANDSDLTKEAKGVVLNYALALIDYRNLFVTSGCIDNTTGQAINLCMQPTEEYKRLSGNVTEQKARYNTMMNGRASDIIDEVYEIIREQING